MASKVGRFFIIVIVCRLTISANITMGKKILPLKMELIYLLIMKKSMLCVPIFYECSSLCLGFEQRSYVLNFWGLDVSDTWICMHTHPSFLSLVNIG